MEGAAIVHRQAYFGHVIGKRVDFLSDNIDLHACATLAVKATGIANVLGTALACMSTIHRSQPLDEGFTHIYDMSMLGDGRQWHAAR